MGIEPTPSAWKAEVLPLNYTRFNPVAGARRRAAPPSSPLATSNSKLVLNGGGGWIRTTEGRAVRFTV